jgi:DNA-binding PadR family transcriptional regulator
VSIRQSLLALLRDEPKYGYQLRREFDERTGGMWPLNVGQVYTTLARLERDGHVSTAGADDEGRPIYAITDVGRRELQRWFDEPVPRLDRPRDELAIKLAMAVSVPGVDVREMVQRQRAHTLRSLQELTRLKAGAGDDDLAWTLVVEAMLFEAEAEIRWLDHCEARVVRARRAPSHAGAAARAESEVAR